MATDFTLPELGENITSGDVVRVMVKPGDMLANNQAVLEIETDKATIEVPSSVAGRVADVKVKVGDKLKVGELILSVEDRGAGPSAGDKTAEKSPAGDQAPAKAQAQRPAPPKGGQAVGANTAAKVPEEGGLEQHVEGTKEAPARDKAGKTARPDDDKADPAETADDAEADQEPAPRKSASAKRPEGTPGSEKVVDISRGARPAVEPATAPAAAPDMPPAPAAPSVRRMARELGVDVNTVQGSGPAGRISIEDVKAHAKQLVDGAARTGGAEAEPLPDFARWGEVERQPMRAVRRKAAQHLAAAWRTIPHVTQHDLADITALDEVRKHYAKLAETAGGALTVTAIAVKVVASALKVFPKFNASLDPVAEEIIFKKYVNIGVAVDTDRGLLVPVIRDADTKNIIQISVELSQLSEKARTRKIALDEMQGGSFSISNLGGIGGTFFTPIVNAPEVAILGISRARMEPVYKDGALTPRLMLPLSLSYDHRVIDGADGIRFVRWIAEALEQPFLLALQG
jgi:pyruvate dehydrogenase E2 component (dihydrolipoamide acetyltransferase)